MASHSKASTSPRARKSFSASKTTREEVASNRRLEIIETAATVFRERGYSSTSMRDIADRAGILGGSLYHHFASKDALYAEAHGIALERAGAKVAAATEPLADPWQRLEAACRRHLEIQLAPEAVTVQLMGELPRVSPELRSILIAQRNEFEAIYRRLVDDLPLDSRLDRSLYRTFLLSLINATPSWYRSGHRTPVDIVEQIMLLFRREAR